MNMKKIFFSIILIIFVFLSILMTYSLITNKVNKNKTNKTIVKKGDYIYFGKYFGDPILWRCENKNEYGLTLVSEYIIDLKPFDAAESGVNGQGNTMVEKYGSNVWDNSNIREWLNSNDVKVNYTTTKPTKKAVDEGYKGFSKEPGFLTNFTKKELDNIVTTNHGSVDDKVFLPSLGEVDMYFSKNKRIHYHKITEQAVENADYKSDYIDRMEDLLDELGMHKFEEDNYWYYWTRDGDSDEESEGSFVYRTDGENGIGAYENDGASIALPGILPALVIKSDICKSGDGTIDDPCRLKLDNENKDVKKSIIIKKGDFIFLGKYDKKPLLWKCENRDDKGSFLVSNYIVSRKPFDAAESGELEKGKNMVEQCGSNIWENSNIKEWLNSDEIKVKYTTQEPNEKSLAPENAYSNEPGFLYNFTNEEKQSIFNLNYANVESKVFLLTIDDINKLWSTKKDRKHDYLDSFYPCSYFILDHDISHKDYYARIISEKGMIGAVANNSINKGITNTYDPDGILPALYIKSDILMYGEGSRFKPYYLTKNEK
jgi:hypothetical protein